jgi:mannose-1-phosphate guanylyltransferase/mannose-6-phosphate isomerase
MTDIIPVILCGGAGTRLWPLSREYYPKQLLNIENNHSLLQNTLLRIDDLNCQKPLLVCNEEHRFLVAQHLHEIACVHQGIILEPFGKNTAPALAIAALHLTQTNPDAVLLVLPADHVITQANAFLAEVKKALPAAQAGRLVMFGIVPNYPETGYGYIRYGQQNGDVYAVDGFFEKPDLATAKQYLKANEFLWNSGMFLLRADVYLKELEKFNPQMLAACQKTVNNMVQDRDFMRLLPADFSDCPEDSIDYAVMEKTQFASVIPLEAGWSDVGSYSALWDIAQKDAHNNAVRGDVVLDDVNDCYIRAESRLVTALGVDNLVIVETEDALLVAAKDKVQNIKNIVAILRQQQRPHLKTPHRVYRPWGYYETIHQGERHQVKRIGVRPNASLSLQMHYHRAEHWVVVQGTAEVTCGERVFLVEENQSTYIPVGNKHRLRNLGKIWLEIIEVQSGSYLGEDDIVRFEDHYGRVPH